MSKSEELLDYAVCCTTTIADRKRKMIRPGTLKMNTAPNSPFSADCFMLPLADKRCFSCV